VKSPAQIARGLEAVTRARAAGAPTPRESGYIEAVARLFERADSLAWDTHKMLGTSALCCGALFRDAASLAGTYAQHAPYLYGEERPGEDLSKKTFECTKAMIALKLFFNLATVGEAGMAAHVERLHEIAARAHALLSARPGFECFGTPESNIVLFRRGRDSAAQDRLREQLVREGDFFITRVTVRRETWLRLVMMNPLTTEEDVRALADRIDRLSA